MRQFFVTGMDEENNEITNGENPQNGDQEEEKEQPEVQETDEQKMTK